MPSSACQNRVTAALSYVACTVSSGNEIGSGTSDGSVEISTGTPARASAAISSS